MAGDNALLIFECLLILLYLFHSVLNFKPFFPAYFMLRRMLVDLLISFHFELLKKKKKSCHLTTSFYVSI